MAVAEAAGVDGRRLGVIAALGTAQTLAWGSSYHLPAILADPSDRGKESAGNLRLK